MVEEEPLLPLCRDGAVTPHRRFRKSFRQDLLGDLPHRDLVVVRRLAARKGNPRRSRHDRRNEQRSAILGNAGRVKRPPRHLGESYFDASGQIGVKREAQARPTCCLDECSPAEHPALTNAICHRNPPNFPAGCCALRRAEDAAAGRRSQSGTDDDASGLFWANLHPFGSSSAGVGMSPAPRSRCQRRPSPGDAKIS